MKNDFFQSIAMHSNVLGIDIAKDYFLQEALKDLQKEQKDKERLYNISSTLVRMIYRIEKLSNGEIND
ncbi:MAG: hypothetical protein NTX22_11035 [Ignavibacteriales bacterium]|nr:hypothetical protein [Ignavibacteriales bacterium]